MADLEAGRELDALIAEGVMGWTNVNIGPRAYRGGCGSPPGCPSTMPLPHYSTNMTHGWRVVEKMRGDSSVRYRNLQLTAYCYNRTYATFDAEAFTEYDARTWAEASGEHSTPHAICLAALLATSNPERE